MKLSSLALVALAPTVALAATPEHVRVAASFEAPAKRGGNGAVVVTLSPKEPGIHVNEQPAPRLKLDGETVLVDKQAPRPKSSLTFDPDTATYLDPEIPVRFPVAFAPKAPKGSQHVSATVIYFYCSQTEGWCRRGVTPVEVGVNVP
jgi:hypothetical protein